MNEFIPPNYNLLAYELNTETILKDHVLTIYCIMIDKYENYLPQLWWWLYDLDDNQLKNIHLTKIRYEDEHVVIFSILGIYDLFEDLELDLGSRTP